MNTIAPHRTSPPLAFLLGAALLAGPAAAQEYAAGDAAEYTDGYASGEFGRIAYVEGGLTVERADFGRDDDVVVNAPIYPGDTAITGRAQRAEIQLAQGATLRLDLGSELTFFSLPDPYADFRDDTVLQLARGALRVDSRLTEDDAFRIDTPAASIYLLGDADVRVEVTASGRTFVASRGGVAEVVGDGGSVLVRAGMQTAVDPGYTPDRAAPFHTFALDAFDRWVERREEAYRVYDRYPDDRDVYEELPAEVRPYRSELAAYGSWRRHGSYGWVWSPRGVSADWRPYTDGYWHYGPRGYFWVGSEPWGWAPYRYGRWVWWDGWCWVPGRVFGGAWVAWSYGSSYVGWAPLDYWDRPVVAISVSIGGYCPRSWNFLTYGHFHARHYRRHYVPLHRVGHDVDRHVVARRAIQVGPDRLAGDLEARRQALRVARANPAQRIELSRAGGGPKGAGFREAERAVPRSRIAAASANRAGASRTERVGARGLPGRTADAADAGALRDRQAPSPRARRISAEGRRDPGGDAAADRVGSRAGRADVRSRDGAADRTERAGERTPPAARPARPAPGRATAGDSGRDRDARDPRERAERVESQRRDATPERRSIYQRMAGPQSRRGADAGRGDDDRRQPPPSARPPQRREPPERAQPPQRRDQPERAQPQPRQREDARRAQPQRREEPQRAQPQRREEPQRAQPQRREEPSRARPQPRERPQRAEPQRSQPRQRQEQPQRRQANPRKRDDGDRGGAARSSGERRSSGSKRSSDGKSRRGGR